MIGRRTRRIAFGAIAISIAALPACGTKDSSTPATTVVPATLPVGPGTHAVPISTVTASSGSFATIQISVGGGSPVTVRLDTGSAGLVVNQSALGPGATVTSQPTVIPYSGVTVTGSVATAQVTIGDVVTPQPISITVAQGACPNANGGTTSTNCTGGTPPFGGTQGILGIGLANGPTLAAPTYSPLLQLGPAYASGYTVELASNGAGTLLLGPVPIASNSTTMPMTPTAPATYPNGAPGFQKDAQLCWSFGVSSACGPTDFDLGAPEPNIAPGAVAGLPTVSNSSGSTQAVKPGTNVGVSASQTGPAFWQFAAGTTPPTEVLINSNLGSATTFNTGIGFFFSNFLGYDLANSRFVITPQ